MGKLMDFPDWESLYKGTKVEELPWFFKNLDPDLEETLKKRKIVSGKFLDIGTGPATQAIALAEMGFQVTGSDVSTTAIEKARNLSKSVEFIVDDMLNSKLKDDSFDYVFDRGTFHVIEFEDREKYIQTLKRVMKKNGILFLKCFSDKEPPGKGPFRYSEEEIKKTFDGSFVVENIKHTVYQGTMEPFPKALFVVLRKK